MNKENSTDTRYSTPNCYCGTASHSHMKLEKTSVDDGREQSTRYRMRLRSHKSNKSMENQEVKLNYEGKPWTAKRLKRSSYIYFRDDEKPNSGMTWSVPDESMTDLAWRIYHTGYTPTREELFAILSVIDSYRSLLASPAKKQRTLARVLLQFILPNVERTNDG